MATATDVAPVPKRPPPLRIITTPPKRVSILRPKAFKRQPPPAPRAACPSPRTFSTKAPNDSFVRRPKPIVSRKTLRKFLHPSRPGVPNAKDTKDDDERFHDVDEEEEQEQLFNSRKRSFGYSVPPTRPINMPSSSLDSLQIPIPGRSEEDPNAPKKFNSLGSVTTHTNEQRKHPGLFSIVTASDENDEQVADDTGDSEPLDFHQPLSLCVQLSLQNGTGPISLQGAPLRNNSADEASCVEENSLLGNVVQTPLSMQLKKTTEREDGENTTARDTFDDPLSLQAKISTDREGNVFNCNFNREESDDPFRSKDSESESKNDESDIAIPSDSCNECETKKEGENDPIDGFSIEDPDDDDDDDDDDDELGYGPSSLCVLSSILLEDCDDEDDSNARHDWTRSASSLPKNQSEEHGEDNQKKISGDEIEFSEESSKVSYNSKRPKFKNVVRFIQASQLQQPVLQKSTRSTHSFDGILIDEAENNGFIMRKKSGGNNTLFKTLSTSKQIIVLTKEENEFLFMLKNKRPVDEILDKFIQHKLENNVNVTKILYKSIIQSSNTLERLIDILLNDDLPSYNVEIPFTTDGRDNGNESRLQQHRLLISSLLLKGPKKLRLAIVNSKSNNKVRGKCLDFFCKNFKNISNGAYDNVLVWKCTTLIGVFTECFRERPQAVISLLSSHRLFARTLIKYYITIDGVSDLLCLLVSRDGASNPNGILVLSKLGAADLLVGGIVSTARQPSIADSWYHSIKLTHASTCVAELSRRAVCLPRFSPSNCTLNVRTIRQLNAALQSLSLFANSHRMSALLAAAPLPPVMRAAGSSLVALRRSAHASRLVIRKTLGAVDSRPFELAVAAALPLVSSPSSPSSVAAAAGAAAGANSVTEAVCDLAAILLASAHEDVRATLLARHVPRDLLNVHAAPGSVTHHCVLSAVRASAHRADVFAAWADLALQLDRTDVLQALAPHRPSNVDNPIAERLAQIALDLDKHSEMNKQPCGGPIPKDVHKVCLLADAKSLAARLDDVDVV